MSVKIDSSLRVREIEYYLRKSEEKRLKVKLRYEGNVLEKVKIEEEKKRLAEKNKARGGGATKGLIDFLA